MKISMPKLFPLKFLPVSLGTLFLLKDLKSRMSLKCSAEEEEDFSVKDGQITIDEQDPELSQDEEFMKVMQDPALTDEERAVLKRQLKQQSIQPFPFGKLHAPFKLGVDEEKWNGVRGILEWSPNQINKMEYTLILDNKQKPLSNYKMSVMSIIPFSERSQNGAFLIGRKEGDQSLGLQCHLNLSDSSKILLVSSHPKPDINQGHYVFEYSHDFERLNATVKVSNMETSVSSCAAVYKNIFLGFEAVKHPQAPSFLYNYGICVKPSPQTRYGFALSYISAYPAVSFDFLYNITRQWTSYLSVSKNWHPMAKMGGQGSEIKMTHVYNKKDKFESNVEVDITGLTHFYHTHSITKNIGVQVNLEINPFARWDKKNKKVFRSFGLGIKYSTSPIEEEISSIHAEESFEEYEFERIATENIK